MMQVMGIVNATPDSFSDGGAYGPVAHALRLRAEGADWVDVGGESTRPGAAPVAPEEEERRVLPVVRALVAAGAAVSIDTRHASTAAAAIQAGARMVNDVSAGADPEMFSVTARAGAALVLMHMRGVPATMQGLAHYDDVQVEVWRELEARRGAAVAAGCHDLWLDPGIGFAKTADQSLALLRGLRGRDNTRVLVGASRKSMLAGYGAPSGAPLPPSARLEASLAVAIHCATVGVGMVRVHDVAATRRALAAWSALS